MSDWSKSVDAFLRGESYGLNGKTATKVIPQADGWVIMAYYDVPIARRRFNRIEVQPHSDSRHSRATIRRLHEIFELRKLQAGVREDRGWWRWWGPALPGSCWGRASNLKDGVWTVVAYGSDLEHLAAAVAEARAT